MPLLLEICVEGLADALEAGRGGADRIELCEHLAVGGVTPSSGAIGEASARSTVPLHVLIRPRGGDFRYDDPERAAMRRDVDVVKRQGAAGVVIGALTDSGAVDRGFMADLIARARPLSVTFHRAFDIVADFDRALDDLIALGVDRVLTSGGRGIAREGLPTLARLAARARGQIQILAGGKVTADDFEALAGVGIGEVHVGSAAQEHGRTDAKKVEELVAAARRVAEASGLS